MLSSWLPPEGNADAPALPAALAAGGPTADAWPSDAGASIRGVRISWLRISRVRNGRVSHRGVSGKGNWRIEMGVSNGGQSDPDQSPPAAAVALTTP